MRKSELEKVNFSPLCSLFGTLLHFSALRSLLPQCSKVNFEELKKMRGRKANLVRLNSRVVLQSLEVGSANLFVESVASTWAHRRVLVVPLTLVLV